MFAALARETALIVSKHAACTPQVFMDGETARLLHEADKTWTLSAQVYVLGWLPTDVRNALNPSYYSKEPFGLANQRFLFVVSPDFSSAVFGAPSEGIESQFDGLWTIQRSCVGPLTRFVAQQCDIEAPSAANEDYDGCGIAAMRMMTVYERELMSKPHDSTVEKEDLFSVLEILKCISAKRRSHDILFVFVEEIARVVGLDRCSVVRIWGGEPTGHVLASHEDESIRDLAIDLAKYPELCKALESRAPVVVNDCLHDPLVQPCVDALRSANIRSIVVIPICLYDPNVGSLLLRGVRRREPFVPRDISFCEIVAEAAANALERAHLFDSIQQANERLERLAVTDGLTGLYNHRFFQERLAQEFARAQRYRTALACMMLDIDDFKSVNDAYGHIAGDSVLRQVGARTLDTVRKSDVVARYGGEEFAILMPQTDREGAMAQALRLHDILVQGAFKGIPRDRRITVSIGVAVLDHKTMQRCEQVLEAADRALYAAKGDGKNKVVLCNEKGGPW